MLLSLPRLVSDKDGLFFFRWPCCGFFPSGSFFQSKLLQVQVSGLPCLVSDRRGGMSRPTPGSYPDPTRTGQGPPAWADENRVLIGYDRFTDTHIGYLPQMINFVPTTPSSN